LNHHVVNHEFPMFSAHEMRCNAFTMLTQSWTWIGSIHGLDWIVLYWIGLDPITVIPCFFFI